MELADEAVARLNRLALLNDGNLVLLVRDLVRSANAAAPSCIGVIITIGDEEPFHIIDDRLRAGTAIVRASLRAQFAAPRPDHPGRQIVLLAERPGEFKEFTTTTLPTTNTTDHLRHLVLDEDLETDIGPAAGSPQDDHPARLVDQALGVLLDRGFPPTEALQELRNTARAAGRSLPEQAQIILLSLPRTPNRAPGRHIQSAPPSGGLPPGEWTNGHE
jgi:hypothetical protein